tara:strand:- start:341517 stop:341756 length:240 start_codon:yes stop_codon:yes gene_type:complete
MVGHGNKALRCGVCLSLFWLRSVFMTIVSGGLFQRLRNTKANMNHVMDDKTAVANDEQGKAPENSESSKASKLSGIKSV